MRLVRFATGLVLFALLAASVLRSAEAGPPCICWPIDIGDAKSLPWGEDAFSLDPRYDATRLADDTLAILDRAAPTLVRMETLRRATLYLTQGRKGPPGGAWELFGRLAARVLDAEAKGLRDPRPWFDAAYFAGALRQDGPDEGVPPDPGLWLDRALALSEGEAEMEFGAALVRRHRTPGDWRAHARRALDGAKPESLLAKNLLAILGEQGDTLTTLRSRLAAPPEGSSNR